MIYYYRRAGDTRTCRTRIELDGPGSELVITDGQESRVERFDDPMALADRVHELRYAWLLNGWRAIEPDIDPDEDSEDD